MNKPEGPLPSHLHRYDQEPVLPPTATANVSTPAKISARYCEYCDEQISINATKCKHCGSDVESGQKATANATQTVDVRRRDQIHSFHRSPERFIKIARFWISLFTGIFFVIWGLAFVVILLAVGVGAANGNIDIKDGLIITMLVGVCLVWFGVNYLAFRFSLLSIEFMEAVVAVLIDIRRKA